jgi:hypothetical protein
VVVVVVVGAGAASAIGSPLTPVVPVSAGLFPPPQAAAIDAVATAAPNAIRAARPSRFGIAAAPCASGASS